MSTLNIDTKNYRTFVDKSILLATMDNNVKDFFVKILPSYLDMEGTQISIPITVIDEIKKIGNSLFNAKNSLAEKILIVLSQYYHLGYMDIYGDEGDKRGAASTGYNYSLRASPFCVLV